ncbi:hypothetical protein [Haloferula sp.]|uniref:hypothetical protein n=1 Tax=Haloferula sp. TaxID=2497595 RepID=UPI003C7447CB
MRMNEREKQLEMVRELMGAVLLLFEFEEEFGNYPSDDLADQVRKATGTSLPLTGDHVLNQFEAFGVSDGRFEMITPKAAKGEWLYLPGMNTDSYPDWPVVVTPAIGGKRFALRIGGMVSEFAASELDELPAHISDPVVIPKVR